MAQATAAVCDVCKEPAAWQCPVCKTARYCDAECQKLAWQFEGHIEKCGTQAVGRKHDGHHRAGGHSAHAHHHVYNKAKWEHMAKESKWTPKQRRYFWYRASQAPN